MQLENDPVGAGEAFETFPEVLLPSQLDPGSRFGAALGERRMLWAMLLDAAACFYKHRTARDNNGRKLFRDAEKWICTRDDPWPFSFQSVCDVLGLNAHHVRVSLLECVYGKIPPRAPRDEDRRIGERGPRQLRHVAGTRSPRGDRPSRLRQGRVVVGDGGDPLARALSRRG